MSFAITNFLRLYARWREDYLRAHPEKRLFPWLFGIVEEIPVPEEPILTVTPRLTKVLEDVKIRGILAVVLVFLALSSSD